MKALRSIPGANLYLNNADQEELVKNYETQAAQDKSTAQLKHQNFMEQSSVDAANRSARALELSTENAAANRSLQQNNAVTKDLDKHQTQWSKILGETGKSGLSLEAKDKGLELMDQITTRGTTEGIGVPEKILLADTFNKIAQGQYALSNTVFKKIQETGSYADILKSMAAKLLKGGDQQLSDNQLKLFDRIVTLVGPEIKSQIDDSRESIKKLAEKKAENYKKRNIDVSPDELIPPDVMNRHFYSDKFERPLPMPSTPEEAMKLPVGTKFRTPDNQIKVR
jgi:hypothetical protein